VNNTNLATGFPTVKHDDRSAFSGYVMPGIDPVPLVEGVFGFLVKVIQRLPEPLSTEVIL